MFLLPRPRLLSRPTLLFVPAAALAVLLATGCNSPGVSTPAGGAKPAPASTPASAAPAPISAATTPNGTPGDPEAGAAVYSRICLGCHQFNGEGLPVAFPPLAGSPIVTAADPGKAIRIVLHGLQGPIEVKGATFNSIMPAPAPALSDQDIADVLTFVRSEWGNDAPPVTVEAVTAIRALGPRTAPWTWAELEKL
jgi:mono/diheme cytochrome c family protein